MSDFIIMAILDGRRVYDEEVKGGYPVGTEKDIDLNDLVADDGARELHHTYEALPELPE